MFFGRFFVHVIFNNFVFVCLFVCVGCFCLVYFFAAGRSLASSTHVLYFYSLFNHLLITWDFFFWFQYEYDRGKKAEILKISLGTVTNGRKKPKLSK